MAEFTDDAGGLLQPQLVSPARASEGWRSAGVAVYDARQEQLMLLMLAAWG